MTHDRSAWEEGRRAWKRLGSWFEDDPDEPGDSLRALADVGRVRHLLDQAELRAVKAARSRRASWAEIATRLGVTRQAAWEKWRDLDDEPAAADDDERGAVLARAVAGATRRMKGTVAVPDVVGLSFADARDVIRNADLVPLQADPDLATPPAADWGFYRVVRQYPDSGTRLRVNSQVRLWIERGGESGVREPRRPGPPSRELSGEVDLDVVVGE
jgi:hypothetical protein